MTSPPPPWAGSKPYYGASRFGHPCAIPILEGRRQRAEQRLAGVFNPGELVLDVGPTRLVALPGARFRDGLDGDVILTSERTYFEHWSRPTDLRHDDLRSFKRSRVPNPISRRITLTDRTGQVFIFKSGRMFSWGWAKAARYVMANGSGR